MSKKDVSEINIIYDINKEEIILIYLGLSLSKIT